MGVGDDIKNAAEKMAGKAKEGVGKLTDNEKLENDGRMDQAQADVKKVAEDAKDAVHNVGENVKDSFTE